MNALDLLRDPVWQRLAMALLHFVWQGALIALVLGGSMWLLRVCRPQVRYSVWLGGLVLMALCPAVTFIVAEPSIPIAASLNVAAGEATAQPWPDAAGGLAASQSASVPTNGFREQVAWAVKRQDRLVAQIAPYLVLFWFTGVGIFGARLLLGFAGVHWLALGRRPPGAALAEQAALLAQRIGLRRVPRVAICTRAREALAVGFLRPLILLPAVWVTELPPQVLQAVLAHELAHIRRRDVWVNLLQRVVETLLFYHPAVWWVSRRVRAERELCCDDLAVKATGGRVEYAQALECVARRRLAESSPLLAAGIGGRKMALLKRVGHVLGTEPDGASRAGRWSAGLIALAVPPALWLAVSVLAPPAVGQEERERGVRERERPESPEAREREREARPARGRDYGFGPEFEQAFREAQLRRGMTRLYTDPEEFEQTIREAQRQAREAEARAKEARHRAEEMMRRMMQRRDERIRPGDEREEDARERGADRPGPEEIREMMERRMRLRAEGFGPDGPPFPGLVEEIRRLREEVEQLRREVQDLRGRGERRGAEVPRGRRTTEAPAEAEYELELRERDGSRTLMPRAVIRRPRPDRPPHPPEPPIAPRVRIQREERRDEDRREETRDPERDERREKDERNEPAAETAEAQEPDLVVRTYPVADLIVVRDGDPDFGPLKKRLEETFFLGTGLLGWVRQYDTTQSLVIRTTPFGHARIQEMLTSIRRRSAAQQKSDEEFPPPVTPSQDPSGEKD